MEIVDELMTPGCPNCFVKHMSAAVARMVACRIPVVRTDGACADEIALARALVNLVEAYTGYESHFDYAIGLMEIAEECAVCDDLVGTVEASRAIRVKLAKRGFPGIPEAVRELGKCVSPGALAAAHVLEALRELEVPGGDGKEFTVETLREMIASVRKEYFEIADPEGKGGE